MQMTTNQGHRSRHVETERDPLGLINGEGMITGTVVSAAAIAAAAGHFEETRLVLAVFGTAFIYWLAHLHARTLGDAVKHRKHPKEALRESLAETWPILAAAVVPAVILIVMQLLGAQVNHGGLDCRDRLHSLVGPLQLRGRPTQRTQHRSQCRQRCHWPIARTLSHRTEGKSALI